MSESEPTHDQEEMETIDDLRARHEYEAQEIIEFESAISSVEAQSACPVCEADLSEGYGKLTAVPITQVTDGVAKEFLLCQGCADDHAGHKREVQQMEYEANLTEVIDIIEAETAAHGSLVKEIIALIDEAGGYDPMTESSESPFPVVLDERGLVLDLRAWAQKAKALLFDLQFAVGHGGLL